MKIEIAIKFEKSEPVVEDFEKLDTTSESEEEFLERIFAEDDEELFLEAEAIASAIWFIAQQEASAKEKREAEFLERIEHHETMKALHEEYSFLL